QPDPALKQERMQRRAGGVDLKQPIEKRRDRWSRGQPHGHDLVVPETELTQLPCAQYRRYGQDDDKEHHRGHILARPQCRGLARRLSGGSRQIHDQVEWNEEAEDRLLRACPLLPGTPPLYTIKNPARRPAKPADQGRFIGMIPLSSAVP